MSIVEFEELPSWSLDASETGESTKYPWVVVVGLIALAMISTNPTHGHFVLSPISLASRNQDGGPSNSTNDIYHFTIK